MQIKINKPTKYVDSMLFQEESGLSLFIENGAWFINGAENENEALTALENHNPINSALQATNDKAALLAKLGITADEAKLLLS
jgi:hypothetical protein